MSDEHTLPAEETPIKPYSVHTFMLPMRWDYLEAGFSPAERRKGDIPFDKRTDLKKFTSLLTPKETSNINQWVRKFYRIDNKPRNYNELVYYHSHAAVNFFDLQHELEPDEFTVHDNKVCLYFELRNINRESDLYKIFVTEGPDGQPKEYVLKISGITLHVYTTGVCVLSFTLRNDDYPGSQDILFINEFGRRIYPPFIDLSGTLKATKRKALADKTELQIAALGGTITEDFSRYEDFEKNNIETHKLINDKYQYNACIDFPKTVKGLFDSLPFVFTAREEETSQTEMISLRLLTSDRMYFQCWYGNNDIAKTISNEIQHHNGTNGYMFARCKFWYAFMYGDRSENNLGVGNPYFMEQQLLENTYTRWAGYGTVYGFTNDSFVCLSENLATLKKNDVPDLSDHMQTLYYTMAVLNLVQRASALRFSGEVATLADIGKAKIEDISKRIQDLNLNYIEFINKVYYREISPEIQGIEIYNRFQQAMNIEADVNDLKMEINELFAYVKLDEDSKQSNESHTLTKVATIFLPAGLVLGLMSINAYDKENMRFGGKIDWPVLAWIGIALVLSIVTGLLFTLFITKRRKK